MRTSSDWAQDFDDRPVWTVFKLVVLFIVGCAVIGGLVWGATVVFSGAAGAGQAHIDKNSAPNFESAQRAFHSEDNQYLAIVGTNGTLTAAVKQQTRWEQANPRPTDPIAAQQWGEQDQNYATVTQGLSQTCHNVVTEYNTNAQSYLTQDFRDEGLPATLDDSACNTGS